MITLICLILIFIAAYLLTKEYIVALKGAKITLTKEKEDPTIAILIPARDESKVISNLLDSIKKQTYKIDPKDIYIIVESKKDKTIEIAKKRNINIILRKNLTNRRRKGYALDDAIKEILKKKKHYDIYFIFDADNILDRNYFKEMIKSYKKGYDIGIGYRNTKNGNMSIYSACSSLTFSMINTFSNNYKMKHNITLTVSGTGFYIKGDILEELGGYPFNSLTEDYELTLYATLNDLTSTYNIKAKYFDEQPTDYNTTIKQRTRWVKGYFDSRRKYYPLLKNKASRKDNNYPSVYIALVGVKPYVLLVISILLYIANLIYRIISNSIVKVEINTLLLQILVILLAIYVVLLIFTGILLIKEKDNLRLTRKMKIKSLFFNPLFLASYVKCLYLALKNKDLTWEKIEHTVNIESGSDKNDNISKRLS